MSSDPLFRVEPLANHERKDFACGEEVLHKYFRERITQDIKRRAANGFITVENATGEVAGFYTLAATSVPLTQ